jgi:hypothetical protein
MHRKILLIATAAFPILAAICMVASSTIAAPTESLVGDWQGVLANANQPRHVLLHVMQVNGRLSGMLDSPDENLSSILISSIRRKNLDVQFEIARIESSFSGKMNRESSEIAGEWKQGGMTEPLTFVRGGK